MDTPQTFQSAPPVQPVTPPASIPPVVPKKSSWPLTITLITVLVLGYGVLAWSANLWPFSTNPEVAVSPTPSVSASPDAPAGWKTYTNTQYGFEVKYPVAYEVRTQIGNPQIFFPETELITSEYSNSFEPQRVSITVGKQTNLSLQEWVRQKWPIADGRTQITQNINALVSGSVNATIDGHAALRIDLGEEQYTFIDNGNKQVVRIFCWAQPLCSQILSTFKFTDTTAGWKTYTNTQYGFEFKYPSTWKIEYKTNTPTGHYIVDQEVFLQSPATVEGLKTKAINPGYQYDLHFSYVDNGTAYGGEAAPDPNKKFLGNITVGGVSASEYTVGGQGQSYLVEIDHDLHMYVFSFDTAWDKSRLTNEQSQMLSAFKFTR